MALFVILMAALALGYAASLFMARAASLPPLWNIVIAVAVVILAGLMLAAIVSIVTMQLADR